VGTPIFVIDDGANRPNDAGEVLEIFKETKDLGHRPRDLDRCVGSERPPARAGPPEALAHDRLARDADQSKANQPGEGAATFAPPECEQCAARRGSGDRGQWMRRARIDRFAGRWLGHASPRRKQRSVVPSVTLAAPG
jgi:hypothetical protein